MEQWRQVVTVGALASAVGSVLPWAQRGTVGGVETVSGVEGDGALTLVFGLVALGLLVLDRPRALAVVGAVCGALTALVAGVVLAGVATAGVGVPATGVYVTLLGGVVLAAGSLWGYRSSEKTETVSA